MAKKIRKMTFLLALSLLLSACGGNGAQRQAADTRTRSEAEETVSAGPAQPAEQAHLAACEAWLSLLAENREAILGYDWQKGMIFDEDYYETVPAGVPAPVAFADVWGDEEPELLYLTVLKNEGWRYGAELHVCAWEPSGPRELLRDVELDLQAGGGMSYRLFQTDAGKDLWLYTRFYSEGTADAYTRYSPTGEMKPLTVLEHEVYIEDDETAEEGWREAESWSRDGKDCAQAEYAAAVPAEAEQKVLMRNAQYYEYTEDAELPEDAYPFPENGAALTLDGAVAFLRGELGIRPETDVDEAAFFASLPDFVFASGAGGWSTELSVEPDGSFHGIFHDSDMGTDGPGYPYGTVYISVFSGRFGEVKYVDDYTRSMRVLEMKTEQEPDEEWIEDGVRYVSSAPYGLENAEELLVYLPGAWLRGLPMEFVTWISMPRAWGENDRPVLLPFYGLYNAAEKEGFSGEPDAGVVYASWAENTEDLTFDSFTADDGEPSARVLLTASAPVSDFRVLALTVGSMGEAGVTYQTKELYRQDALTPERPLLLTTVFHGDTPNLGIAYVDGNGTEQRFALDISGMDGSVYLSSF